MMVALHINCNFSHPNHRANPVSLGSYFFRCYFSACAAIFFLCSFKFVAAGVIQPGDYNSDTLSIF